MVCCQAANLKAALNGSAQVWDKPTVAVTVSRGSVVDYSCDLVVVSSSSCNRLLV